MRRAIVALAMLAPACAAPAIRLTPAFVTGAVRTYVLRTSSTTTLDLPGRATTVRAELVGRSRIEVTSTNGDRTSIHVTLTPRTYESDGRALTPPPEQSADLVVGPDGSVEKITSVGGLPPEIAGADVSDLAPLLGPSLPTTRVHLGDVWHRSVPEPALPASLPAPSPIEEDGRVTALRIVGGYDCAIVQIGARRPISRDQRFGQQDVQLAGTEFSTSEIAFAFRAGFPVKMTTGARARLALESGTFSGGALIVESQTVLTLVKG